MEVRFTLRFHRSNSSYCASSAATCSAVNSTMPASRRVRASANTAQAQVDIQNRNRGRGNTRNPRRLTQCFRPHTFEFGLNLAGKAGYAREAELRRDRPPPGVFHPLHLALLLRDIATVLDLRFDGSHQTAHRSRRSPPVRSCPRPTGPAPAASPLVSARSPSVAAASGRNLRPPVADAPSCSVSPSPTALRTPARCLAAAPSYWRPTGWYTCGRSSDPSRRAEIPAIDRGNKPPSRPLVGMPSPR